jgi:hypothetical protein
MWINRKNSALWPLNIWNNSFKKYHYFTVCVTLKNSLCNGQAICYPRRTEFLFSCAAAAQCSMAYSFLRFLDHTQPCTSWQDDWSARHTDFYLTTYNAQKKEVSKPPAGFEPTIPASERKRNYSLDRTATGIGRNWTIYTLTPCSFRNDELNSLNVWVPKYLFANWLSSKFGYLCTKFWL